MPTPNSVTLIISLPEQDYAAYLAAGRHLVRVMGNKAPDLLGLVVRGLLGFGRMAGGERTVCVQSEAA